MAKIDVTGIIRSHLNTLRNYPANTRSIFDTFVFFGIPLIAAGVTAYIHWGYSIDALNAMLAAFAIFAGLLLNLLLVIFSLSPDSEAPSTFARVKSRFIREVFANIAFAVLVSVCIVVTSLYGIMRIKSAGAPLDHTGPILTFLVTFLTSNFVLTLLMILKRIHAMIEAKLSQDNERPAIRRAS